VPVQWPQALLLACCSGVLSPAGRPSISCQLPVELQLPAGPGLVAVSDAGLLRRLPLVNQAIRALAAETAATPGCCSVWRPCLSRRLAVSATYLFSVSPPVPAKLTHGQLTIRLPLPPPPPPLIYPPARAASALSAALFSSLFLLPLPTCCCLLLLLLLLHIPIFFQFITFALSPPRFRRPLSAEQ